MIEGLQTNNNVEKLHRKEYEDFRKEILAFKDLPESTFSNVRGQIGKLEPQEARNALGHGIMQRIESFYRDFPSEQKQFIELVHLWEKEIMGISEPRTMYDDTGNIIG